MGDSPSIHVAMKGAHLTLELLAEPHDETSRDQIHRLDSHKHGVLDHRRMDQEQERRQTPQRECWNADASGATLLDEVNDLRNVSPDDQASRHEAKTLGNCHLPLFSEALRKPAGVSATRCSRLRGARDSPDDAP